MKPVLSSADYQLLQSFLEQRDKQGYSREIHSLKLALGNFNVVHQGQIPEHAIGLNTEFEIQDQNSGNQMRMAITMPVQANLKARKISVLAPLSLALLGRQEGDTVSCELPGGHKTFRILKVSGESQKTRS